MASNKTNLVFVGGYSGAYAARLLSHALDPTRFNLTLINARPFSLHLIAAARLVVTPGLDSLDAAFCPLDRVFYNGNGSFVCGTVTGIEKNEAGEVGGRVVLADGQKFDFDVLVLATGSVWTGPLAIPDQPDDITRFLQKTRKMFKDAHDIILVGGGPASIELAGEIKDEWPDKSVTIMQRRTKLLTDVYFDKFRDKVAANIRRRGIDVLLDDSLASLELPDGVSSVVTRNSVTLKADLIVPMWGTRPNTGYIASSLGTDALSKDGYLKVTETLQLPDHPEIFAIGDMIDWPEVKQGLKAGAHVRLIEKNVVNYVNGKPLKPYKGSYEVLILTGGKEDGIGYVGILWGVIVGAWFVAMSFARNLAVSQFRRGLGY